MKKRNKHLKKANRLQKLTPEEIQDPGIVIEEFFTNYHLCDVREELWDWLNAALSNNHNNWHPTGRSRSNLLFLFEQLQKLTEAVYLSLRRNRRKKK